MLSRIPIVPPNNVRLMTTIPVFLILCLLTGCLSQQSKTDLTTSPAFDAVYEYNCNDYEVPANGSRSENRTTYSEVPFEIFVHNINLNNPYVQNYSGCGYDQLEMQRTSDGCTAFLLLSSSTFTECTITVSQGQGKLIITLEKEELGRNCTAEEFKEITKGCAEGACDCRIRNNKPYRVCVKNGIVGKYCEESDTSKRLKRDAHCSKSNTTWQQTSNCPIETSPASLPIRKRTFTIAPQNPAIQTKMPWTAVIAGIVFVLVIASIVLVTICLTCRKQNEKRSPPEETEMLTLEASTSVETETKPKMIEELSRKEVNSPLSKKPEVDITSGTSRSQSWPQQKLRPSERSLSQ